MRGGFSFCGIDIADIGLEYAPENKDTYVYAPGITNIHEENFEGHNGGYFYGASKEPKTFTLRCYYENKHIAQGIMAKIFDLFRVGKKGMLIFKRRPWMYYYATVTERPNIDEMYSYLNGLVTITMKAYYPYARGANVTKDENEEEAHLHLFYNLRTDPYHREIIENTAILEKKYMVPQMSFTGMPNQPVLLYNPGTERAKVDIVISGAAGKDGVIIHNSTTDQSCKYVKLENGDGEVRTDGINGKTVVTKDGTQELAFLYHDYGFIELEPAFPILRGLCVTCTGTEVKAVNILYQDLDEKEWYANKYIFIGKENNQGGSTGSWKKILRCVDKHTLLLSSAGEECSCTTSIVPMNEITIIGSDGTAINKLAFIYKPTYS